MQVSDLKDIAMNIGLNYGDVVRLLSGSDPMTISKINGVPGTFYENTQPGHVPIECIWYYEGRIYTETIDSSVLILQPPVQRPDPQISTGDLVVLNSGSCVMAVSSVSVAHVPISDSMIEKYQLPPQATLPPFCTADCVWFYEGRVHQRALDVYDLTLIYDADSGRSFDNPTPGA